MSAICGIKIYNIVHPQGSFMPELYSIKIISHQFHSDNNECEVVIFHDMIRDRDLMIQLGLTTNFKQQFLSWGYYVVPTKELVNVIGQPNKTKHYMIKVFINNTGID